MWKTVRTHLLNSNYNLIEFTSTKFRVIFPFNILLPINIYPGMDPQIKVAGVRYLATVILTLTSLIAILKLALADPLHRK